MTLDLHYARIIKHGGSFRVSLPREVRDALNLRERDYLVLHVEGDKIIMKRADPPYDSRRMG